MRTVLLYGRPGCHLCDDARVVLESLRARVPFHLEERDITEDDALHRRYLERIPVICVDGAEVCEAFVEEADLLAVLRSPPG